MIKIQTNLVKNQDCVKSKSNSSYVENEKITNNPKALNNTLKALALLGLSTIMTSCVVNNVDEDYLEQQYQNEQNIENTSQTTSNNTDEKSYPKFAYERMDNILSTLGLLQNDNTSIKDVQTLSFTDEEGNAHWIKPRSVDEYTVYGECLNLTQDDSEISKYFFIAKNALDGRLNVIKMYPDGKVETVSYKLNNDGSVTEYDVIDKNYLLEKANYKKQDDGTILKTNYDGKTEVYGQINNDIEFPTPI